jgi:hypothetical protein
VGMASTWEEVAAEKLRVERRQVVILQFLNSFYHFSDGHRNLCHEFKLFVVTTTHSREIITNYCKCYKVVMLNNENLKSRMDIVEE